MKGYINAKQSLTGRLSVQTGSGSGIKESILESVYNGTQIIVKQADYDIAYERLEYLENTNTMCINTGYCPTDKTKAEVTFSTNDTAITFIYGSRTGSNSSNAHALMWRGGTYLYAMFGNTQSVDAFAISLDDIHTIQISQNGAYVDGVLLKSYTEQSFISELPIYLFTCNNNNNLDSRWFIGKIYRFKVWENDTLVMDLQPCERMVDGVQGMLDKISRSFFEFKEVQND